MNRCSRATHIMKKVLLVSLLLSGLSMVGALAATNNTHLDSHKEEPVTIPIEQNEETIQVEPESHPEADIASPQTPKKVSERLTHNKSVEQPVVQYTYREILLSLGATEELIACTERLADRVMKENPSIDRHNYIIGRYNSIPGQYKYRLCEM